MICIPIMAEDTAGALRLMERASVAADLMELRLDVMSSFDLKTMINAARRPVIVTYRSKKEGGRGLAPYETRVRHLRHAMDLGADYVDVEYSMPQIFRHEILREGNATRIILSSHIPGRTPDQEELESLLRKMAATGAGIVKLVTFAAVPEDNLKVLGLIPLAKRLGVHIITFCMGELGRISRIFSLLLGGYLSFAALETGLESASGQIPVNDMRNMLGMLSKSEKGLIS